MWVWRVLAHAGVAEEPTRAGRAVSGAFVERVREHSWKDGPRQTSESMHARYSRTGWQVSQTRLR